jgi:zinc transport system permease protein
MAFIGTGIAHSAFGGAGLAILLGMLIEGLGPALARDGIIAMFCVVSAVSIGFISRRGRLAEDTSIGISLVAAMALGVLLLDVRQHLSVNYPGAGYVPPLEALLFGQILTISPQDALGAWILAAVIVGAVALTFKELTFFAFDEETATVFGVPTTVFYYGFLVLLGLAIVAAMRSLGVILASALLVLPGATARTLAHRIGAVTLYSAAVSVCGMIGGLLISLWLDYLTPGPVIALTYCAMFALAAGVRSLVQALRAR